jgi:hypothetical protein
MNENTTQQLQQTTTLSDGTVITPAIPDPLKLRRDVMAYPYHSSTRSTMASTSEFTRYFLLALPSRYIFRSMTGAAFDDKAPNWLRKPVDRFLNRFSVNTMSDQIHQCLAQHPLKGLDPTRSFNANTISELLDKSENSELRKGVSKVLNRWSAGHELAPTIENAYRREAAGKTRILGKSSVNGLRNAARTHVGAAIYGAILGVGSVGLTISYARQVYRDIKNVYAEAVAFEFDKRPEDIRFNDLRNSKNELVQQALHNFRTKTGSRFLTDLPFFAAVRFPNLHLADLMIGVKGAQLFAESWRRRNSMFEDIVTMVNNKVNPFNGLGDPITTAEILDLYQHYHYHRASDEDLTFNTIIERNTSDSQVWAKSQRIFSRVSELLNETYAYKHASEIDEQGRLRIRANFALPQFFYLLGNNMINPREPEKTLAFIETANSHGMQAVKDAKEMFDLGMSLEAVMARFPIDRTLPSNQRLEPDYLSFPATPNTATSSAVPAISIQPSEHAYEGRISEPIRDKAL